MRIVQTNDVSVIEPLAKKWHDVSNAVAFGLKVIMEDVLNDLDVWLESYPGTIIVAMEDPEYDPPFPVGFFAVFAVKSFLSNDLVALEKYWFSDPESHKAGVYLYKAALKWAADNGCTHLILSASNLASDQHDKVCKFCEAFGMNKFETSYIVKVT